MRVSVIGAGASRVCREPVAVFFLVAAVVMAGGVFARSPTMTQISIDEGAVESTRARLASCASCR